MKPLVVSVALCAALASAQPRIYNPAKQKLAAGEADHRRDSFITQWRIDPLAPNGG
jgi:hypothetical protein